MPCYNTLMEHMMKGMRKIKPEEIKGMMEGPAKSEVKKVYPHVRIDLKHLPEAKKWEIGKKYLVSMELEQTGITQDEYQNTASFDIHGIKAHFTGEKPKRYAEADKDHA